MMSRNYTMNRTNIYKLVYVLIILTRKECNIACNLGCVKFSPKLSNVESGINFPESSRINKSISPTFLQKWPVTTLVALVLAIKINRLVNVENEIAGKYEVSRKEWEQNRAEGRGDYHLERVRWLLLPAGKDFQQMRAHDFYYSRD